MKREANSEGARTRSRKADEPQRGKAAAETAEYAKYAEVGTQSITFSAYSAYSAVPFVREVARRLRATWSIAVQMDTRPP